MITADYLRKILHYNPKTGVFTRLVSSRGHAVGEVAGKSVNSYGYSQIVIKQKFYKAHRLAWLYMTGEWPPHEIDHINLDKSDNRFCNLREATHSQNNANRRTQINNTAGLKGVGWHKKAQKWQAQIMVNNKQIYLGCFDCPAAAHFAYIVAADVHHGDFARAS